MSEKNTLYLLDGMALIFRAHFALSKNPRINSKGMNTSAAMGFTNSLWEILNKYKPSHIGVAFDLSGPTFRHEMFPEYKAHRDETPEDISIAIPIVKQIVEAFNIPLLSKQGFEADDVIGTIAKKAARTNEFEIFMVTPDKDYAQLVEEHIFQYKPAYMGNGIDILGIEEVKKKFDIDRIDQVVDFLGLQGDAADNIPGVPGVGPKTAVKLLRSYGTVEGILEHIHEMKGKQKERFEENKEQALLSKELAKIKIDVDVEFDAKALKYDGFNQDALSKIFDELEFKTLGKRIFGEANAKPTQAPMVQGGQMSLFGSAPTPTTTSPVIETVEEPEVIEIKNINNTLHDYHLIDTPELRKELIGFLSKQEKFSFDTETTSLEATEAELVGLSFSYRTHEAYYVPVSEDQEEAKALLEEFRGVFENEKIEKIGQNIKYDILVLMQYGIEVKGKLFDTMLAHYLLEPDKRHGMDTLAETYLHYECVHIEDLIGKKGKNQLSMRDVSLAEIKEYAAEDADITWQLAEKFRPMLSDNELTKLYDHIEIPLVSVLASMENYGVNIDKTALKDISKELGEEVEKREKAIYEAAGEEFNIASPKQLGVILFEKMKLIDKPKKTKSGQYATGEEILQNLAKDHPIVQNILDFRQLQKLKNTYVDALPKLVSKKDGRIHTSYNQAVAATGRLSSTNPNLQNIPIRTERGREIRKAFVPQNEDYIIMAADYSQVELRLMASFSQDTHMVEAFKEGKDIHTATAAKVFKIEESEVNSEQRRRAKTANFGIIYGVSAFGLSQQLNIPRKEANDLIETYFKEFPMIKQYMNKAINEARDKGYCETIMGRKRYLRDINSRNQVQRGMAERNAINAPIQGSAADIIKVAMIEIHDWMNKEKLQSRMIMQVHDELVFEVHKDEIELMKSNIKKYMEAALQDKLQVPLEVEVGMGEHWLEAH